MLNGKKIVVVLPAYNTERTLEQTYREIPLDIVDRVLLVDDGSVDNTIALAKKLGIETISHDRNYGYGRNQKTCYRGALRHKADIVIMVHPDYQYTPKLITAMASMIAYDVYDVVLGSRIIGGRALKGGMPIYKYIANRFLTAFENLIIGSKLSEFHTGYRAFSREVLVTIPLNENSDDFVFDNEMLVQIHYFGYRIGEISCPTKYFEGASSIGFRRAVKYGVGVMTTTLKCLLHRLHLRTDPLFNPEGHKLTLKNGRVVMKIRDFGQCPFCHGSRAKVLFSTKTPYSEFHLVQCQKCNLTRTSPLPADKTLQAADISTYYGLGENKFITIIQKIRNETLKYRAKYYLSFIPGSIESPRILDVGCAEGRLLQSFLACGCQCWGIESPSYPTQRFLNPERVVYLQGELNNLDLPERKFDLILLWHVLEHMDDPQSVIKQLFKLLSPEGAIILVVPNLSSLEARRFKQFWFHLDIPWHKYHFNERSIRYLIKKNRLRVIRMSTLCFEQGPYGLFQSILNTMGWPRNEFYEALKGNLTHGRFIHVFIQFFIGVFLLVPVFSVSFFTSIRGRGPVIKLILRSFQR